MISSSIIFSAKTIHVLIRNILIFFIILFISLFVWLSIGIKIDTLQSSGYRIDGLYIKLNKKIILQANKITIPKSKKSPSFGNIDKTFGNIKYLLAFFNKIDLKDVVFNNNRFDIYFYNDILQISSKDYLIRGNVHKEGRVLIGDISKLYLKEQNVTIKGKFKYDLDNDSLMIKGKLYCSDLVSRFRVHKVKNKVKFFIDSNYFSNIKEIVDKFNLIPALKSWVVDRVKAKRYKILSLTGGGDIVNSSFKIDRNILKAKVLFDDVTIDFKDGLSPVVAKSFILNYRDSKGLFFDLKSPRYKGKNLNGSSVSIVNLLDKNITLKLDLHINSTIDKEVKKIVNAYGVKLPILQTKGRTNARVKIDVGLKNSKLSVLVNATLDRGNIVVHGIPFKIISGNVFYLKGHVYLNKVVLFKKNIYSGVVKGDINLHKYKADFMLDTKYLKFKTKDNFYFTLENKKIPIYLNYKNNIVVDIPKFSLNILGNKKSTLFIIKDLKKIQPYISDIFPIDNGGRIKLKTLDFNSYTFSGVLDSKKCFFYQNSEKSCLSKISYNGIVTKKGINIYAFDKRLHYNSSKSTLDLQNLNIDLKKFLNENSKHMKSKNSIKLIIVGSKSYLKYDKYLLKTDIYSVRIKNNGDIIADGRANGDILKFTKINNILTIQADRIKDSILHHLINFDGLKGGRYSLINIGVPDKVMRGEITVEGGVLKNFKTYNNILAFINTIPELVVLHKPGYSSKGFNIKSAFIDYHIIKRDKIIFDSINIEGESATIVGKGYIDINTKKININLKIKVARKFSKILGSIPLLGYILVGKDKSITVGLKIRGTTNNPKVSIMATKDILSYPFQVIKRTLKSPIELFSN